MEPVGLNIIFFKDFPEGRKKQESRPDQCHTGTDKSQYLGIDDIVEIVREERRA